MNKIKKIIIPIILTTLMFTISTTTYATEEITLSPPTTPVITPSISVATPLSIEPSSTPIVTPNTSGSATPTTTPSAAPSSTPIVTPTTSASATPTTPIVAPSSTPIVTPNTSALATPTTPIIAPSSTPIVTPNTSGSTTPTPTPNNPSSLTPSIAPSIVPSTSPIDTPNNAFSIPTGLEIDTENIYNGMDKAYKDGYVPTIKNELVSIVLPLISTNDLYNKEITVTPDFTGTGSTFIISNYQKTIKLTEEKINNSNDTKSIYYVTFDLPLSSSRSNGTYPLVIRVKGLDNSGNTIESQFTIYINITDVPIITPAPQSSGISTPTAEPVILITDCIINPDKVFAGEEFTMKLTLKNSLSTKAIKNLLVSIDTGTLQINLEENGTVLQLDNINANGSSDLTLNFSSDQSIPAGKYVISFRFNYDTWQSLNISSTGTVIVDIKQPANMELVMPRIPEKTNSGETLPLTFQIMNMGRDSMYNVRCEVSGIGLIPYNTGYVGTMAAGSSAETNVELYVGTLTMSDEYTGKNMYGPTSGTVKLIYEDSSGEEYSQEYAFKTSIGTPIITDSTITTEISEEKQDAASQWWISVTILFVVIIFIVGALWYRTRKQGAHEK